MKRTPYILLFLLSIVSSSLFSNTITIHSGFTSIDIYNALSKDKSTNKDVELYITLINKENNSQQLYLSFINPTIDKIMINDETSSIVLGDVIRFTKREFKHINHVYPILLQANETRTFNVIVSNQRHKLNCRINLSSQNTFIKITNHDNFFMGIFYGIFFMFIILLICFYIFSKSNFFLIYLAINFFMLLLIFQYSGTGYQFIWFYSATIQKYITFFAGIGYFTAHIYFIRTFFNMQFKHGFTGIFTKILLIIIGLFGIFPILQAYNQSIGNQYPNFTYYFINSIFLIYGFMVFTLCLYTYKESKRREIIWIFVGMLLHFFNWLIFINNDFAMVQPLNFLDNWKLFDSNIFVPQLNYYISLLEFFTITVFIAINYYKLIQQNNLSTKRLEFFQKRNINTFVLGQEDEREKISNEIGNTISADILHLKKSIENLQYTDEKNKIPTIINDIDKTLDDIKNITSNYVAPNIQQMKLSELITTATEKIYSETNLHFNFTQIPENFQLNAVANINLYRVLQEISNNIIKHAKAKNVSFFAIKDNKSLQIKIIDDGIGFENYIPSNKGIGLMNIESRMNSLNGNFYILSNKQKGSTIHLIMPLKDIIE